MGKPVKKFRYGAIEAAVFENERTVGGKKMKMFNVSFRRSYKDKNGEWADSDSFGMNDLPKLGLAVVRTYEWLLTDADHENGENSGKDE
jgi:hypothetical protein